MPSHSSLLPALLLAGATALAAARAAEPPRAPRAPDDAPTPEAPLAGVVTARRLNVRLRADPSAPVLGQIKAGTGVVVRRVAQGWCEIDHPPALGAWVNAKLVRFEKLAEGDRNAILLGEPGRGLVTRDGARLRAYPSLSGAVLAEFRRGVTVLVTGVAGDWYRIAPPDDLRAYVHADYVELGPGPAAAGTPAFRDAAEKVALAGKLLSAAGSAGEGEPTAVGKADRAPTFDETRRALGLLEEALAAEGLAGTEKARVRLGVRDLVGRLAPSRWLALFEEARREHGRDLEAIERRYSGKLRAARDALEEAEVEHTARGVLTAPVPGSDRWRLVSGGPAAVGETVLCELDAADADLSAFVGRRVGVIGVRRPGEGTGGPPLIEVRYVEEVETPDGDVTH